MTKMKTTWHQDSPFAAEGYTQEHWLKGVERILDGADFTDTLVTKTLDGIEIQPLYSQKAQAPFHSRGNTTWSIQQSFSTGNIGDVNQQILADLAEGLTAVELTLSSQATNSALPCYQVEHLEQLLKDVHPQMIHLSLTPGAHNTLCGALLLAYYYRQKIVTADIHCALNIDPLGAIATTGRAIENPLSDIAQFVSHCANQYTNVTSLCADSSGYHNAGCTEAQELAYLLATTVTYIREASEQTSVDINKIFNQIRFRLALDGDYFLGVAKIRAARALIKQVAQHCGAESPNILIDAVTGTRSMSALDAATNILRASTQAAAAMAGGANGYNCAPYDLLTDNSAKAQRLARNTQHILIEESRLLEVHDPARGSGYIESLTQSLSESAWTLFQEIEAQGGMHKALLNGLIKEQINTARAERTAALSNGSTAIVGVTDYPNLADTLNEKPITTTTAPVQADQTPSSKVSLTALTGALSDGESTLNYHSAYCASSEVTTPIDSFRDAEIFEQLRLRACQFKNSKSALPTVTLITLGAQKEYAARATFCKSFFAIAGIETQQVNFEKYTDMADQTTENTLLVFCSSDKRYSSEGAQCCEAIKGQHLWIAGNHPKATAGLDKHGVSEKIHLGCDRVKLLESALTLLGA